MSGEKIARRKTLVVTYNCIDGIKNGRQEIGGVITYSGNYGREKYSTIYVTSGSADSKIYNPAHQSREAEEALSEIKKEIFNDLQEVDIVYVYVGATAREGAISLIKDLIELGKEVIMVACTCQTPKKEKEALVAEFNIRWIECGCGGESELKSIVDNLNIL